MDWIALEGDPSGDAVAAELKRELHSLKGEARMMGFADPQVVTLDLEMPELNGLEAIASIMAIAPTRILVVSGLSRYHGRDPNFEALSRGALEIVGRPRTPEEAMPPACCRTNMTSYFFREPAAIGPVCKAVFAPSAVFGRAVKV